MQQTTKYAPVLSICLPTFNRVERVVPLVKSTLGFSEEIEVCVHDDGSTDGTLDRLKKIENSRLHLSASKVNEGQGVALSKAFELANGIFVLFANDDDQISIEGLKNILQDCKKPLPEKVCGFIYHLADQDGRMIGSPFSVSVANFLSLRADFRVEGDKEEVVLREVLRPAILPRINSRRVPPGLYWGRVALTHDVQCRNIAVGVKTYDPEGITANITLTKQRNPYPMVLLGLCKVQGFFTGRYQSVRFVIKAFAQIAYYGFLSSLRCLMNLGKL